MKNKPEIVLSPKAQDRLEEFAKYLYEQTKSKRFVSNYLGEIERYFENILTLFSECGTPMPEYGEGIRRLTYQRCSILYRVTDEQIDILTFYRENQP